MLDGHPTKPFQKKKCPMNDVLIMFGNIIKTQITLKDLE